MLKIGTNLCDKRVLLIGLVVNVEGLLKTSKCHQLTLLNAFCRHIV